MDRCVISTGAAPAAVGPYSQGIEAGGLVFVSGQIPIDPATGRLVEGGIGVQTERAIENLRAVLRAAGLDLSDVAKATVFLTDLGEFAAVNAAYAKHFRTNPPARACVEVSRLPLDARVEIECIAVRPGRIAAEPR